MVVDLDHLERATAGDRALQTELLVLFRDQLDAATELFQAPDLPGSLHRLKGACYGLGAHPLAAAIVDAEAALQRGVPACSLARAVPHLSAAIDQARAAVDVLLAAPLPGGLAKAGESG